MIMMRYFAVCLGLSATWWALCCGPTAGSGEQPTTRGVRAIAFSADGKLLAASTGEPVQEGTVTVWDVATRKPLWTHREKQGIPAVAFSPDGQTLAIGGYNKTAKLLDVADGKERAKFDHPNEVRALAFSPDGKLLATACWDGALRLWDLATGGEKLTCKGPKDRLFQVQFSPDGKSLVSAGHRDGPKLWDAATGAEKRNLKLTHGGFYVATALFTPDGRWLLTGGYDGTVRLWNLATGQLRAVFSGTGGVDRLAFSTEAGMMAANSSLFELTLRDPTAKEQEQFRSLLTKLEDDSYDVREATCQELQRIGFVAERELRRAMKEAKSAEVRIRARQVRQEMLSKPLRTLRGHSDQVETIAFSPDGKLVASGARDGTVRFWDVTTGQETAKLVAE
jgi:WD40 repeat protein